MHTQNLVPNGSFEQYDTCPYTGSQLHFVKHWFSPTLGTPDLYNSCSSVMNVPNTPIGYLDAHDGVGYVGLNAVNFLETEYLAIKLSEPLIANTNYCISFYTSIAQNAGWFCSIEKIGAYLSKDSIFQNTLWYLHVSPQVRNSTPIVDTSWTEVLGNYKAMGGEQYLYIGNFDSLNNHFTCAIDPSGYGTYLFIDNVNVTKASTCNLSLSVELPNVITPNNNGTNDIIDIPTESTEVQTLVYSRWGNLVSEFKGNKVYWDGKCNEQECSDGVYYMIIRYKVNEQLKIKQTLIHLFNH